jgi:hypothetical protein
MSSRSSFSTPMRSPEHFHKDPMRVSTNNQTDAKNSNSSNNSYDTYRAYGAYIKQSYIESVLK